jgi:nitrite reductase/ring-hydroxylating ferredoxin subunit
MPNLRCLTCAEAPMSRREVTRRIGNWVIYLGVLAGAEEIIGCAPDPLVTVGNGVGGSPTPTETPTPTESPTPTGTATATPTGTPDVCGCTASATGVNSGLKRTDLAANSVAYNSSKQVFLCHDSGGYYALSSVCPHQLCDMGTSGGGFSASNLGTGFYCSCHGSAFDANGAVTQSPANSPLKHYQVAFDASGNIWVDHTKQVGVTCRCT